MKSQDQRAKILLVGILVSDTTLISTPRFLDLCILDMGEKNTMDHMLTEGIYSLLADLAQFCKVLLPT